MRLCAGQIRDDRPCPPGVDPVDYYLHVLADKTGVLIATAARYGAMFGGCTPETVETLREYGERLGMAFQLADDLIDIASETDETGKRPGTDLREGVPTLPILLLRQAAAAGDEQAAQAIALVDADLSTDEALAKAVEAVRAHAAVHDAWKAARQWADDAIASLAPLPEGTVKQALISFADAVVTRDA